jgi:hypothetical protein
MGADQHALFTVQEKERPACISEGRAQPIPKPLRSLLKADLVWLSADRRQPLDSACPANTLWIWPKRLLRGRHVTPTLAAIHERNRRTESAHGRRRLEFARSRKGFAGLY